jgi:multisubunit Na+/H+ antiporter MnhB subunit
MSEESVRRSNRSLRVRFGLAVVIMGLLTFSLGADPALFNMDRSPIVGFVQIAVFLIGLAMICLGGYTTLNTLWNGKDKTIAADIGYRLVSTGYVIAVASGMADVFGFGSQPFPSIPYFGPWQASGVIIGELVIIVGFFLLIPNSRQTPQPPL